MNYNFFKKPNTNDYILYDSIYMKSPEKGRFIEIKANWQLYRAKGKSSD